MPLDMKVGFRMLVKYPGLALVAGLAMAFAICVGAVTFEVVMQFVHPTLPLPDGDRIVQIRNWDVAAGQVEPRALYDFGVWRDGMTSLTEIGAYRDISSNLITDGDARPVQVAEITASAFRVAPAAPLMGRVLSSEDDRAGAPPVVVIGYDLWKTRFASDPRVIGRSVQLGETFATVVGVMPDGYGFPVAQQAWIPLHSDVLHQLPLDGPAVTVFGRLKPGVSLEAAQVQLSELGRRAASELRRTHEHLRPQVVSYTRSYWDPSPESMALMFSFNVFAIMLLTLICSNVALLLFARAAAREGELVVRSALGASRTRIIAQLFAEALVLGGVAAVVGLVAAHTVLQLWGRRFLEENLGTLPFWFDLRLSPATVLYTAGLTLLAAAIAGVLPALKVTRGFASRLRQGTAGGGGVQFGGLWTVVIVVQVAFTVAFPALALFEQRESVRMRAFPAGFAADEYLSAQLEIDASSVTNTKTQSDAELQARFERAAEILRQRVISQPGIRGVTFVDRLPRDGHHERNIELDQLPSPDSAIMPLREVSTAAIDPSYFDVLETPILAGRRFNATDLSPDAHVVIVDRSFVDQVLLGRNAIGRRVRFAKDQRGGSLSDDARPWYEIVGVVNELGMGTPTQRGRAAGMYLPAVPGSTQPLNIVVHVQGDPMSFAPRLREVATSVDPGVRVSRVQRVDQVTDSMLWILGLWFRVTLVLTGIALLLALAGIYAVLSFAVARRTREIGVRVALGASPRSVVTAIFRRPLTQVSVGVVVGGVMVGLVSVFVSGHKPDAPISEAHFAAAVTPTRVALLIGYAAFMYCVCLLACIVPTRRALSVEPTEALRSE